MQNRCLCHSEGAQRPKNLLVRNRKIPLRLRSEHASLLVVDLNDTDDIFILICVQPFMASAY